jgi:hypothetical protein
VKKPTKRLAVAQEALSQESLPLVDVVRSSLFEAVVAAGSAGSDSHAGGAARHHLRPAIGPSRSGKRIVTDRVRASSRRRRPASRWRSRACWASA